MRQWILLLVLAALALPAAAAKRVNVAQLEQALTAAGAAHKPDAEVARQIAGMELTECLTEVTLGRLIAHLAQGSQAARALQLLADRSAFLDPPASELPATPAPGDADRRQLLAAARRYVAQSLPRLPNFLATRTINRYDDSPMAPSKGAWPVREGLHRVDSTSREISVRDERENQPPTQGSAVWREQIGLISGGEFGTTLGMILTDTLAGTVAWGHWQESGSGPAAVFHYSVPSSASHFEVIGTLQRQAAVAGSPASSGSSRGTLGIGAQPNYDPARTATIRIRPAYHGSIWLDPASGAVLRILMEAELKEGAPFSRAAIVVEYGPVKIGEATFICPVRSLAFSQAVSAVQEVSGDAPTEWLNETLFTGYHRFASTTRIVTEPAAPQ